MELRGHYHCVTCSTCPMTTELKQFVNPNKGDIIKLNHLLTCASKNFVYLIKFSCEKMYIGTSMRTIRTWILEHCSRIRNRILEAPMVVHFIGKGYIHNYLNFFVLLKYKLHSNNSADANKVLLKVEVKWIFKLNTFHLHGLNQVWTYLCIHRKSQSRAFFRRVQLILQLFCVKTVLTVPCSCTSALFYFAFIY